MCVRAACCVLWVCVSTRTHLEYRAVKMPWPDPGSRTWQCCLLTTQVAVKCSPASFFIPGPVCQPRGWCVGTSLFPLFALFVFLNVADDDLLLCVLFNRGRLGFFRCKYIYMNMGDHLSFFLSQTHTICVTVILGRGRRNSSYATFFDRVKDSLDCCCCQKGNSCAQVMWFSLI